MFELILLFSIILVALVLFIGGWLAVDLVGLLVLAALTLTGLVGASDALAGFSSPAVVTVWAMFILSAGLSRTGIAYRIGQPLQRFAHSSEWLLVAMLMLVASLLSALINTITVAVILLPAAMDLARRSGRPPSRLLLPMALGCLLGGPFTGISTPPNMLVTDALRNAGLAPFAIFDFTPITGAIVLAGILFMALVGRHLLPRRSLQTQEGGSSATETTYQLDTHVFSLAIRPGSPLAGRTLRETRLGSALHLTVLALRRRGEMRLAPDPSERIQAGDVLIVHGPIEHLRRFHGSRHLRADPSNLTGGLVAGCLQIARGVVGEDSPLVGKSLAQSSLRREHRVHVLSLRAEGGEGGQDMLHRPLAAGDALVLLGTRDALEEVGKLGIVQDVEMLDAGQVPGDPSGSAFMSVHVPQGSVLVDHDLTESRLGNAFGLTVVGIVRDGEPQCMPSPEEIVRAGDTLVLHGAKSDLEVLQSLQDLEITETSPTLLAELESQQVSVTEVLLSPRTTLTGRNLAELRFREHYGLNVLALWRGGRARRTGLQDLALQFGDAMLVYGPRKSIAALARDPDFLVLDQSAIQAPRMEKAPAAAAIMLAVLVSAILGLVPISIAALTGAALMVLAGCLSMDEAYRAIEWRVVFLIAGMLPLGIAIEQTGAAQMGAQALIALVGDMGPRWVVAALFLITVLCTQVVPTAALVVLMSPVALTTAADLSISPHLLMMTVAMAASASYASPLSHPAHLLVMGPGGYRFTDYLRVGIPVTIVAFVVCVGLLPVLWPA
ncbi:Citrate transporter [Alkalidesulfovibrio alkalitolerans DSM 16529]|uniref:Citrate transporter n=1 Tax=Alkalidesulfovibrio alkalitolerans DSM 16529 TaxID=1121439 RepID=S7T954_9BACT|nr:SLC13 family permease [Alkalidesulfovibrio alkalitolerans]EPR33141.1 Citrate transporter [Alkalidesulfovibrio alkalitolerans DSM 16529]